MRLQVQNPPSYRSQVYIPRQVSIDIMNFSNSEESSSSPLSATYRPFVERAFEGFGEEDRAYSHSTVARFSVFADQQ